MIRSALILPLVLATGIARAEAPEVTEVVASKPDMGWEFEVTLRHPDTGWDHYADGWEVLSEDGERLGYRKLHHPHVHEQPFTRSLSGVSIPVGTTTVFIEARTNVDGWSEARFEMTLE